MMTRIVWRPTIALAAVTVAVVATPASAHPDTGLLRNYNDTNMCMGISGGMTGTTAGLFRCDGRPNQTYEVPDPPAFDLIRVGGRASGKCLSTRGPSDINGARVVLEPCNRGILNQIFQKRPIQGGFFGIQNRRGLCIGVSGGAPKPGAAIAMFACEFRGNQLWRR